MKLVTARTAPGFHPWWRRPILMLLLLLLCSHQIAMAEMTRNEALRVLGLSGFNYSEKVLKDAYKKRALESHPDKGGSSTQFIRVAEAYELLSGKKGGKKSRSRPGSSETNSGAYGGFNSQSQEEQMHYAEDMFFEMFEDMFGPDGELYIIDKLFDQYLDKSQKQTWMLKLVKSGVKWMAGWMLSAMESDSASITINGETISGSDFRKWRDEIRKKLKERRSHSDL